MERLKAPRTLGLEQQHRILEKVKKFQGTTLEVVTYPWEPEPAAFSRLIGDILVRAGWSLNPNHSENSPYAFIWDGGCDQKDAGDKTKEAATAFVESLASEGIFARLESHDIIGGPIPVAIQIAIGIKP